MIKEKTVPTIHPSLDAPLHNPATNKGSDDALPWFKTIASGRVQKHLMRFVNNFISHQGMCVCVCVCVYVLTSRLMCVCVCVCVFVCRGTCLDGQLHL